MPVTLFGSGTMWAIPTIALNGTAIAAANATPVPFGAMQDVSIDISYSVKELYGMYQFPIDVARGTAKLAGKAKVAYIQSALFNQVFGETAAANEVKVSFREAGNTAANSSITPANAATYAYDLGVMWAANSIPLTRAANAANNGIYAVSANGVYTFGAGDANKSVVISYAYGATTATANTFTINNQLLGLQPYFKTVLSVTRAGKVFTVWFNQCIASKLTLATKLEDFMIPEFDFSMMADSSQVVGGYSVTEG